MSEIVIQNSFTSSFSLFEIISGITTNNYLKRKSIIQSIQRKSIFIDWRLPMEIIMSSFTYFSRATLVDKRINDLKALFLHISESASFEDILVLCEKLNYGVDYFKKMDSDAGSNFWSTFLFYNLIYQNILDKNEYSRNNIPEGTIQEETILALAEMLKSHFPDFVDDEDDFDLLVESYNGKIDVYVKYFSDYCLDKFINKNLPAKNDFVDLGHLFYLNNDISIVSNDRLFERLGVKNITIDCIA